MATTYYARVDLVHPVEPIGGESRERLNTYTADNGYVISRDSSDLTTVQFRHRTYVEDAKGAPLAFEFPWAHVRVARVGVAPEPTTRPESPGAKAVAK